MSTMSMLVAAQPEIATRSDMRWLERALATAAGNSVLDAGGYRLAAIAVRGGRLLGRGVNRHRNDPMGCPGAPRQAWSVHAEVSCLRRVPDAAGATLYVARITPGGRPGLAKPCKDCAQVAVDRGISRIVYTSSGAIVETVPAADLISSWPSR